MELFAKIVDCINGRLFLQNTSYYLFDRVMNMPKTKQNPGVLSLISQKIRAAISANIFSNSFLSSHYYLDVRH